MIAILSDIHANLEALHAVLADIASEGVETVYCLGDVVGYGPDPCACVDLARGFRVTLLGNHDQGALFDPEGFSPVAERAIFWTRKQLESPDEPRAVREARWEFLAERPRTVREEGRLYVHGSARNPLNEYVFPEDADDHLKMQRLFTLVERACFQGHTHVPGVFVEHGPDTHRFHSPEELDGTYKLDHRKVLVNVGSVGQPRDGNWRACYVLLDGDTLHFRRVAYDVDATTRKMRAVPELDRFLAERLRQGR